MDDKPWPSGASTLAWIPEQEVGGRTTAATSFAFVPAIWIWPD
ncbi:hypothetical protein ACNKHK_21005 [Shigella flexneri]